jgi:type II secretory ATPase GspE/PulE/Tfp pilus assembly ATPase PilB-like protein
LQDALHQQRRDRELPLGEVLLDQGVVDDTQLRVALATKLGFPVVDVARFPIDRALLKVLPLTAARRLQVLPLMRRGGRLVVAMHDTSRQDVIDELQRLTQSPIAPTLSGDENLAEAIERAYGGGIGIAYPQPDGRPSALRASARVAARHLESAGRSTVSAVPAALLDAIDFDLPPRDPPGASPLAPSSLFAPPAAPPAPYEPSPSDFIQISLDDLAASPVPPMTATAAPTLGPTLAPRPIESPPATPVASATLTWAVAPSATPATAPSVTASIKPAVESADPVDRADAAPPSDVVDLNDAPDPAAAPLAGVPLDAGPTEPAALPVGEAAEMGDTQVAALTGLGALVADRSGAQDTAEPRPARSRRERPSTEAAEAAASARAAADRHESPLLQTLSHLVLDALQRGASSVQIETHGADDKLQVRLRRGGRLELHSELPASYRGPLFARIKALSDLDIAETRRPQEGRLAFGRLVPQHKLDLRVLTLPTHGGLEDIVLGLPTRLKPMALEAIGLGATELERLQGLLTRPAGLILCVGPARSGRTTSLHAMLGQINQPERRIWTLEEPVALAQPGLRQMEIRPEEGQTFENGLRSLLATDADVLMVGQINDVGTARLAIDAALQGRLVLAGMTARNASDALMRLIDQGVTPWDLSDALLGVHSQRLLRRLCSTCRMSRSAKDTEVEEWIEGYFHGAVVTDPQAEREALLRGWIERHGRDGRLRRYQSPGCDRCSHTGQRGRVAVHELLLVTRELRRLVRAGAPAWNLQRQAQKDGMRTLRQEAVDKMVAGQVSLDEVRTVIDL